MRQQSLHKLLQWLKQGGVNISLDDLFRTAYFTKYAVLDERLEYCIDNFNKTGVVPSFVSDYVTSTIALGESHGKETAGETGNHGEEVCNLWQDWPRLWLCTWW